MLVEPAQRRRRCSPRRGGLRKARGRPFMLRPTVITRHNAILPPQNNTTHQTVVSWTGRTVWLANVMDHITKTLSVSVRQRRTRGCDVTDERVLRTVVPDHQGGCEYDSDARRWFNKHAATECRIQTRPANFMTSAGQLTPWMQRYKHIPPCGHTGPVLGAHVGHLHTTGWTL